MEHRHGTQEFLRTLTRAEGATAAGAWTEAAALWARVVAVNPVEGRFWTRLAEARYRDKDYRGAVAASERALALRDGFPAETAYRIAACHALLGEREQALSWLERAWDLGYRHLGRARSDDDLAALRDDPRFRGLVASADPAGLPRDEGWRADLRLLVREVKRRAYAPFRDLPEDQFDAAVAALDGAIPGLTDTQVILELTKLLRLLGDGHARIRPPKGRADLQRAAPVQFYLFDEGPYVVAAAPQHADLLGARVARLGEHPVEDVLAALDPLLPRDNGNGQWVKEGLPARLRELPTLHALGLIPEPDRATLTVQNLDGTAREVIVTTDSDWPAWKLREAFPYPDGWRFFPETLPAPLPLYLRNAGVPYWFQYLPDERLVYFQWNTMRDAPGEPLAAFSERLFGFVGDQPVEKLVIDLRWNDGGNTFLAWPLLRRLVADRKVNRRGALFAVVGRRTFSAAQNSAGFLDAHTEATFVGEPTGSSPTFVGESSAFELPHSGVEANVSDLRWVGTWPGDHRTWIAPTLYAPPTFAAYRANRDPALEAILACDERLPG